MEHGAWGKGHGAWGMGQRAWSMGHGAWSKAGSREQGAWSMGHGVWSMGGTLAQQVDLKELKEFSNLELPRERSFSWAGLRVTLWKRGQLSRQKLSFPQHYGIYHELETREHIFKYNLRGQICYIQGKSMDWPHPGEWLKRTQGGDWIYYYSGGYTDLRDYLGEFYLPCPDYPSNILYNVEPWQEPAVQKALQEWKRVPDGLNPELGQLDDPELLQLYGLLRENTAARLWQ
ncbi:MAG: hypothetical protein R6U22_02390, partial [Desulfohalobiaceae bacterium]